MRITKFIIICLTVILSSYGNISFASEITGVLSTGLTGSVKEQLTGTVNETLTGTVTAPQPINTPSTNTGRSPSGGGSSSVALTKKGDSNGDGKVDLLDFNSLLIQWGKTGTADFDKSGTVDIFDFNLLLINWNK